MTDQSIHIIFLSDTHLGQDYPLRPRTQHQHRGADFFLNFKNVLEYAVEIKADLVIHAGDFFFRSRVPPSIVDKA
ncbi:MAG: metallophosphoesterase, partial [Calditrichales bacterium]